MNFVIGRMLRLGRQGLGLSQAEAADRLGVPRQTLSQWERLTRQVPESMFAPVAALLSVNVDQVIEVARPFAVLEPEDRRRQMLPPYPVKGSLKDLPEWFLSKVSLSPGEAHELEHGFPRDTRHELAIALQLSRLGASLGWCSLQELDCPLHVVGRDDLAPAGHLFRHCMHVERNDHQLLAIPQVSTLVVAQSRVARLDYLVRWKAPDVTVWANVEADGGYHEHTANDDRRRNWGLGLRRIAFDNDEILMDEFNHRLVAELKRLESDVRSKQN